MKTLWSPNFHRGRVRPVLHIVIHTMEAAERSDTAENVARWFLDPKARASAHYCIDDDSEVQGVNLSDTAWACPGFNASGVQFEHAGFAAQDAGWSDDYSTRMLHRSARLAADVADDYGIAVRRLTAAQLRNGNVSGFLGHGDATAAGIGGNTHTDPGGHFPWTGYLDLVAAYRSGVTPTPPAPAPARWYVGPEVQKAWARLLGTPADGVISGQDIGRRDQCFWPELWPCVQWAPAGQPRGSQLVKAFQRGHGLTDDGIIGPATMRGIQAWVGVKQDGRGGPDTTAALCRKLGFTK